MQTNYPIVRPPLPPGIKLEPNVYVTMRDGVKLAVDIYRPEKEGRYPGLLALGPYIKELQQYPPQLTHSIEAGATSFFVPKGYVHIIASVRGTGFSQGQYNYYDPKQGEDGRDLVEWVSRQPWCDGNVGMIGDSYFTKMQYATAALQPAPLKCIVPYDGGTDQYRDVAYQGGLFWSTFVGEWGVDTITQCLWPGPVEGKLPPADWFLDVLQHPEDGPYYWEKSAYTKLDKIKTPMLSITPLSAVHSRGQLHSYPAIKAPKKLLVVPSPGWFHHVLFLLSKPLNEHILRWLDYWLKGIDTGIMNEPEVTIFDSGSQSYHYEDEYPLKRTEWTRFYLRSNPAGPATAPPYGLIGKEPPGSESPDRYKIPDMESHPWSGTPGKPVLAYATPPLDQETRVWGPVSITLYGSAKTRDTVWFVKLFDIAPDGKKTPLTAGHLKASFRAVDETRSRVGQPFHPFQNPVPLEPDVVYDFQIEMHPIFHTFKKGHRVWVQVASDDYGYQGAHRTVHTYEALPGENTIYHDAVHPSHLLLPVISAPGEGRVGPPVSEIRWPL